MATINLYQQYQNKLRKLGYTTSTTLQESFVEAVNLVYAELNDQVFQAQTLPYIGSFDDVIDERLWSFTSLTFDADSIEAMGDRDYWSVEYQIEKTADATALTDTFLMDDASEVVLAITSGVFSIAGDTVLASAELTTANPSVISFEVTEEGNRLKVDGADVTLTYTGGDETTIQALGAITQGGGGSRIINGTSGLTLMRTRFLTDASVVCDFLINEGTGVTLTDEIADYTATLLPNPPVWKTVWIEPSSNLDSQYLSPFNKGMDYHLQDGGQWAIEPEPSRERKWYVGGIRQARNILQHNTTYSNPLGI